MFLGLHGHFETAVQITLALSGINATPVSILPVV
jgi:hypothetical protein